MLQFACCAYAAIGRVATSQSSIRSCDGRRYSRAPSASASAARTTPSVRPVRPPPIAWSSATAVEVEPAQSTNASTAPVVTRGFNSRSPAAATAAISTSESIDPPAKRGPPSKSVVIQAPISRNPATHSPSSMPDACRRFSTVSHSAASAALSPATSRVALLPMPSIPKSSAAATSPSTNSATRASGPVLRQPPVRSATAARGTAAPRSDATSSQRSSSGDGRQSLTGCAPVGACGVATAWPPRRTRRAARR